VTTVVGAAVLGSGVVGTTETTGCADEVVGAAEESMPRPDARPRSTTTLPTSKAATTCSRGALLIRTRFPFTGRMTSAAHFGGHTGEYPAG
jgi:hypothetical protein